MISLMCRISINDTNDLILKAERDLQKTNLQLPKGREVGEDKLGIWDSDIDQ